MKTKELPKYKDVKESLGLSEDDFIYLFKIDDYKFFMYIYFNKENSL